MQANEASILAVTYGLSSILIASTSVYLLQSARIVNYTVSGVKVRYPLEITGEV